MNVEVISVSRKEQKLSRTASAVFVISQEDIQRSGAANIPDVLRMVPGMEVAQINASAWAISARGFNSEFSSKLLVLVDGRNVYTPSFGGVFWDTLDLPLENIERIEVIRGPGGSVWGENAVNGVVNIIQKKAADTRGGMVVAGGGNTEQGLGTAQYGGSLGQRTDYRVYSKYFNRDAGREGDPTKVLPSIAFAGPVNTQLFLNVTGGALQSTWNHTYSDRSDSTLMTSYDSYERSDRLGDKRKTFAFDFHQHRILGRRHDLVWGFGYRRTAEDSNGTFDISLNPPHQSLTVLSGFVQYEVALIPDSLYLTAGTKLERNSYSGFAPIPSLRASCEFSARRTAWAAISRAVRTPATLDVSVRLNVAGFTETDGTPGPISIFGNPHAKDEGLTSYEAGYRETIGSRLSVDLAAYYNDYDNQTSIEPAAPFFEMSPPPAHIVLPSIMRNLIYGETHGVELAVNWKVTPHWTVTPSYDFERIHMHREAVEPRPNHRLRGRGQRSAPARTSSIPCRSAASDGMEYCDLFYGPTLVAGRSLLHADGFQLVVALDRTSVIQFGGREFIESAAS